MVLLAAARAAPRAAFASAALRSLSTSAPAAQINHVTVFGAGLMGSGIGQVLAQNGFEVTISDTSDKALKNGHSIISKSAAHIAKKKGIPEAERPAFAAKIADSINWVTDPTPDLKKTDLVIEAIVENIGIKQKLFKHVDEVAPAHTILTSNTSSLSISEIAEGVQRKDKFAGFHAFNPVPLMKLIEVIRTDNTSDQTIEALLDVAKRMGKSPARCKDTPGFIVNRLLVPYMADAIRLLQRGDAQKEDIDTAMKLGAGYPMGPFELSDMVGLDTLHHILSGWKDEYVGKSGLTSDVVAEIPILEKLVSEGKFGRKSGEGFYKYK